MLIVAIDDGLELVGIQNDLREYILETKQKSIAAYVSAYATGLTSRPAFAALFARLAGQLVDGQALDIEGLVDVLTLKDNRGPSTEDPVIALDRLIRDTVSHKRMAGSSANDSRCPWDENRLRSYRPGAGFSFAMS